jgi:hypothetical protein
LDDERADQQDQEGEDNECVGPVEGDSDDPHLNLL